ncbi:hypothetical protein ACOMHN_016014 [Nucella lapillus]
MASLTPSQKRKRDGGASPPVSLRGKAARTETGSGDETNSPPVSPFSICYTDNNKGSPTSAASLELGGRPRRPLLSEGFGVEVDSDPSDRDAEDTDVFLDSAQHNTRRRRRRHRGPKNTQINNLTSQPRGEMTPRSKPRGDMAPRNKFPPPRKTQPPAFVDFPVVLTDCPGPAIFSKLGPWMRSESLKSTCGGAVASIRPLPSGKWLVGCVNEAQQAKLARASVLTGGVTISAKIPVPTVEGVVSPIPLGEWAIRQVRADLQGDGYRTQIIQRLRNKKGEDSRAVRIVLERTELPSEVWIGQTPFQVVPFAAPVRRCTKCQRLGHSKTQCRAKIARCSRCGRSDHEGGANCGNTLSCVNCSGRHSAAWGKCPEMLVRYHANILRSATYIPYSIAMQRARADLSVAPAANGGQSQRQVGLNKPDPCWAVDREYNPLTMGMAPAPSYAQVAAGGVGRAGAPQAGGPAFHSRKDKPESGRQKPTKPKGGQPPPRANVKKKEGKGVAKGRTNAGTPAPLPRPIPQTQKYKDSYTSMPRSAAPPKDRGQIPSVVRREELRRRAAKLKPFVLKKQQARLRSELEKKEKIESRTAGGCGSRDSRPLVR